MITRMLNRMSGGWLAALLCACVVNVQATPLSLPGSRFLAGGDVSVLGLTERNGARYTDREGREGDALSILAAAGHNIVRLRLYDRPGPGHGDGGWHGAAPTSACRSS